jgi:hypothetical protein
MYVAKDDYSYWEKNEYVNMFNHTNIINPDRYTGVTQCLKWKFRSAVLLLRSETNIYRQKKM